MSFDDLLRSAAREIGREGGLKTNGVSITAWASSAGGSITGTIVREARPTFQSAAPGLPPIAVRRWLLVLEVGTVAVGHVLTAGGYTFRVSAVDAETLNTWEVQKQ